MSGLDDAVERAGRWLAGRQSRRSFLGRAGKAAVLVAAGPTVATLLADRAEARVCGQSGVAPKCPTFDCLYSDSVWGWCWYASDGCCRNGGLKKICDCCTLGWPNVHGYCPTGHNVRCIVESCGTDPRVQTTLLTRLAPDATGYTTPARSLRYRTAPTVVVADADAPLLAAVAAPVAGVLGAPFLRFPRAGLGAGQQQLLSQLQVRRVVLVAPALAAQADALRATGLEVEVVGTSTEPGRFSEEVAAWIRGVNRIGRTVTISPEGLSGASAGTAAVFAAAQGFPLLVGGGAAQAVGRPSSRSSPTRTPSPIGAASPSSPRGSTRSSWSTSGCPCCITPPGRSAPSSTGWSATSGPTAASASAASASAVGASATRTCGGSSPR
ncbi:MAG: hypothetical protein MUE34_07515 [Acidimicrobiales bacterium]|nr:hypothetical protein [Acidimicrobiales bacterium]